MDDNSTMRRIMKRSVIRTIPLVFQKNTCTSARSFIRLLFKPELCLLRMKVLFALQRIIQVITEFIINDCCVTARVTYGKGLLINMQKQVSGAYLPDFTS